MITAALLAASFLSSDGATFRVPFCYSGSGSRELFEASAHTVDSVSRSLGLEVVSSRTDRGWEGDEYMSCTYVNVTFKIPKLAKSYVVIPEDTSAKVAAASVESILTRAGTSAHVDSVWSPNSEVIHVSSSCAGVRCTSTLKIGNMSFTSTSLPRVGETFGKQDESSTQASILMVARLKKEGY